jgi:hypothetical protein
MSSRQTGIRVQIPVAQKTLQASASRPPCAFFQRPMKESAPAP